MQFFQAKSWNLSRLNEWLNSPITLSDWVDLDEIDCIVFVLVLVLFL